MLQVIVPNIRGAIVSASVITVALVLGEFTISSLLNFDTLQVVINLLGKRDAFVAVAVSLRRAALRVRAGASSSRVFAPGGDRTPSEPAGGARLT